MVQVEGAIVQCSGNQRAGDTQFVECGQVIRSAYTSGGIDPALSGPFLELRQTVHIGPLLEPDMRKAHHDHVVRPEFGIDKKFFRSEKPAISKVERQDHFGGPRANIGRAFCRKRLASDHGLAQAKVGVRCSRLGASKPGVHPQVEARVSTTYPAQYIAVISGSCDRVEIRDIQAVK